MPWLEVAEVDGPAHSEDAGVEGAEIGVLLLEPVKVLDVLAAGLDEESESKLGGR